MRAVLYCTSKDASDCDPRVKSRTSRVYKHVPHLSHSMHEHTPVATLASEEMVSALIDGG
tara:strand:- start:690 stop:869 length:180 start_codon:yes stop_codon:yes gene_type:complete